MGDGRILRHPPEDMRGGGIGERTIPPALATAPATQTMRRRR
jgi:hypothetical protein